MTIKFDGSDPESSSAIDVFLKAAKFPAVFVAGSIATLLLFYLMQYLIDSGEEAITEYGSSQLVDFVRLKQDPEVKLKQRRPKPPQAPEEPPPPIDQVTDNIDITNAWSSKFVVPMADVSLDNSTGFASDGEYLPIVKVQPVYPRSALQKGQFGWVVVEFTVDELGRVIAPTVVSNCVDSVTFKRPVCEDRPGRTFDRAALNAAVKFKYKPKVVDGVPIATASVRNMITFELAEMKN